MVALKKGQKLTDTPKDFMLRVRMDKDTLQKLNECAEIMQVSKSEVVRYSVSKQYALLKGK